MTPSRISKSNANAGTETNAMTKPRSDLQTLSSKALTDDVLMITPKLLRSNYGFYVSNVTNSAILDRPKRIIEDPD
ncbi:MAG TPA: hypothetical protein DD457_11635 [Gammaproteobacteria bacterium]|nr:hypothetical protein [Gammaproteobacteria bacterium]HBP15852.1 hypothetical protein [Gammaproteobacteria bacterium]